MPNFIERTGAANPLNGLSQPGFGSQPVLVDLDRDGDLDLVIAGSPGTFSYYRNTGTATAPAYVAMTGADNPFNGIDIGLSSSPAFGNLDDAGELDMVVGGQISGAVGSSNPLQFFQNTGAGYSAVAHPVNSIEPGRFSIPTLGDLDSDGLLDMIVGSDNGLLRYYRNTGTSSAASFTELTGASNPFNGVDFGLNSAPRLFDHDRDGDLDLIVGNLDTSSARASSLAYYRNDGPASAPVFVALTGSNNPFAGITADTIAAVALGDIDGDGDTDLVLPTRDGGVRLLLQNRDPVAVADNFSTDEDTAISGNVLLANPTTPDSDLDGDSLTVVEVNGSSALVGVPFAGAFGLGSLTVHADGRFTFDPEGEYDPLSATGASFQQITYTLSDGRGGRSVGTVNLAISGLNDAPTTTPVTLLPAMPEDSGTRTITQTMLLSNAADVDGPAPKAENLQISGGLGNLVDNGDGTWNYTPAPNDDTSVSFSYSVSDGLLSAAGSATLDLTPVNDAPVAVADSAVTRLNAPVGIAVLANDSDIDGGTLRVVATTPGSGGSAAVQSGGLTVLYTPNTGFSGFDNFSYTVSDGAGGSATASVRVLVASITGSNGNDTLLGSQQADFVVALDGNDRILTHDGSDYVEGGRGADTITGGAGADTLLGGDGPDTFLATSAELAGDEVDGGDGTDTLVITNAPASLPANFSFTNLEQISFTGALLVAHTSLLDLSSLTLASGSSNSITGGTANSRITGTASADNIVDSAGNDDLRGAAGNDTIQGGFGQDTLHGGTGNDMLYGGSATAPNDFVRDIFVFNTPLNASTNVDQIIGFQANRQDQIQLSGSIFAAITGGASSGLDAGEFLSVNGGNALDGNDFILFDPATGNLFYDADGNGPGAKVLFATLMGLTGTLDATDFSVTGTP